MKLKILNLYLKWNTLKMKTNSTRCINVYTVYLVLGLIEAVKFLGLTETSFSSQENSFYQTNVPLTKMFTNKKMCVTTTMNTTDECYQK